VEISKNKLTIFKRNSTRTNNIIFISAVLIPVVIYYGMIYWYPVIRSLISSFTNWNIAAPRIKFIGIKNFITLLTDTNFITALKNTFLLSLYVVPISLVLSFCIALIFDRINIKARDFFMVPFFLPAITSMVVASVVWKWLLHPTMGMVNYLLGFIGIPPSPWLGSSKTVLAGITIVMVWKGLGYNAILFLTGLQNVPVIFYEAAEIDGARLWHRIIYITLPLIKQTLLFVTITSVIGSLVTFTQVYVLTAGGPGGASRTVPFYIYEQGIRYQAMGYASSIAVVLFFIILILTLIQLQFSKSKWEY
jgi:multiple sugar transport system permease protein